MSYNILLKRLFIIFKSNWISSIFKGKLISFASFEILNNTKKFVPELNTIIDVGANNGQFQKASNFFYPDSKIHSFEPIPELFKKIDQRKKSNIQNHNVALGNEIGRLEFNQNKYNHSSSFYDISSKNKDFPSTEVKKIQVQITTLDKISESLKIQKPCLLKLDVQGFEMEALKGGMQTISTLVDYVILEANFAELYDKQPSFTQLNAFLNQNNFELKSMLDFNMGKDGNYIEADFLYKKN